MGDFGGLGFWHVKRFGLRSSGKSVEGPGLREKVPTNSPHMGVSENKGGYLILGSL